MTKAIRLDGIYNEDIYWKRVNRSLCWLGEGVAAQREAQLKLSNATVGVAGCGGIGGALALRLARLGVRHIKVADPDSFDWTNVNRQMGSGKTTIGKNKAEIVGNMIWETIDDVTVEIFTDGITPNNAQEFVEGCDLVLDQMDFYLIGARYALHRAFRSHPKTKCIISAWCVGWGTSLFKYLPDSMPIEDYFGVPENAEMSVDVIEQILPKFMPVAPRFPSRTQIIEWLTVMRTVPLFAGTPPLAEAAAIQRVALILANLEREPFATVLPPSPSCYVYDGSTFEGRIIRVPDTHPDYRDARLYGEALAK
ncbi:MAG: ThiF family adenylyltransferase [Sulfuriferula sp.]